MKVGNSFAKPAVEQAMESRAFSPMHPAWRSFVQFCERMGHGEIELLKIQDGLPVMAELTTKKVKFCS